MKAIRFMALSGFLLPALAGTMTLRAQEQNDVPGGRQDSKGAGSTQTTKSPRLLWIRCKYNGSEKDKLVESEKLTIAEYRKRGVNVVELKSEDFDVWRNNAGKDYSKATKRMQQVAYANSIKADAIGGLDVFAVSPEIARDFGKAAGDYLYSWGVALKSCVSKTFPQVNDDGKEARAIPMGLIENDPWAIPMAIQAKTCSSNGEPDPMAMMSKGRPFLGVAIEGQKISNVIPGSPAAQAGIQAGDLLLTVAGTQIKDLNELAKLMSEKKPGETVDVETQREETRTKRSIVLADRFAVESRNSPDGKPLPKLTGKDINGKEVRLEDLKGKVVLLEFWATWCVPCVEEMPLMHQTWENLKDRGLVWVGVSADPDESVWRDFVKDNRIGGIQLKDQEWINAMGVNSFPTVLLVDRDGTVTCRVRGDEIAQAAAALLQK